MLPLDGLPQALDERVGGAGGESKVVTLQDAVHIGTLHKRKPSAQKINPENFTQAAERTCCRERAGGAGQCRRDKRGASMKGHDRRERLVRDS